MLRIINKVECIKKWELGFQKFWQIWRPWLINGPIGAAGRLYNPSNWYRTPINQLWKLLVILHLSKYCDLNYGEVNEHVS